MAVAHGASEFAGPGQVSDLYLAKLDRLAAEALRKQEDESILQSRGECGLAE